MLDASRNLTRDEEALRKHALGRPETREDFPWGHRAFKVRKKIFAIMVAEDESLTVSVKLPHSNKQALKKPYAERTGYGLGKHGWVTCTFNLGQKLPMSDLKTWIDESYIAIAPKPKAVAKASQKSVNKRARRGTIQ
jgi:predicted DNA-binding protein (MmcQ/YjbR family)